MLPLSAIRLAGRYIVPLTVWYSLGYLAHYLLTWAGRMGVHQGSAGRSRSENGRKAAASIRPAATRVVGHP
jgi:hypothetical protein